MSTVGSSGASPLGVYGAAVECLATGRHEIRVRMYDAHWHLLKVRGADVPKSFCREDVDRLHAELLGSPAYPARWMRHKKAEELAASVRVLKIQFLMDI